MKRAFLAALAMSLIVAAPAPAGPGQDMVTLEVLPGWQTESGSQMVGLRLTLAPGWKTYWRAPGDAGIPPLFSWQGSQNVAGARFHWPVPEVFDQNGMRSVGYDDTVVIPVELLPRAAGEHMQVSGTMDLGVCEEVCVPVRLDFSAPLPRPGGRDPLIIAALLDRPLTPAEAGLSAHSCRLTPTSEGFHVTATLDLPPQGRGEAVVIEAGEGLWVSEPEITRAGNRLTAEARILSHGGDGIAIDRSALRITVLAQGRGVDIRGCPAG